METVPSPVSRLITNIADGAAHPEEVLLTALRDANRNASRNTYISLDADWSVAQARSLNRATARGALFGMPVALKDCFDLQDFVTTSGSRFYARHNAPAAANSWVAERLKAAGAVITGKTHLHQLAYGITGENLDYGDCLQPANAALLTGGSSSGSAAAVQEGSAVAAIGTDTGGSIRVPAALCGLAGYRASLGLGDWRGGAHLAPSFDTIGWLCKDLRDLPLLASALFDLPVPAKNGAATRVGFLRKGLLGDCDAPVLQAMSRWEERICSAGARTEDFRADFWQQSYEIYAPIQAHEASLLHEGFYSEFEPAIADRLRAGAAMPEPEVVEWRKKQSKFVRKTADIFTRFDFLLMPALPVSELVAGVDNAAVRPRILRYTTPASLAGLPAVVLPARPVGMQLIAARGEDAALLAFAKMLGDALAAGAAFELATDLFP